jgi:hypothetical protein
MGQMSEPSTPVHCLNINQTTDHKLPMSSALLEQNDGQPVADDRWNVAQGEKNGKPLLIRYRSERPQGIEAITFPFLLSATWTYQANEFGLPSAEDMELMDKFEDALVSSLEGSQTAHLMVILTGNSERDWLWYARGEEDAMRHVNQALKGHKRYPVQFSVQKDRAWKAYAQFETGRGSPTSAGGTFGIVQWAIGKAVTAFSRRQEFK